MTQTNRNTTTSDRLTTVLSYGALLLLGYLVFVIVGAVLCAAGVVGGAGDFLLSRCTASWRSTCRRPGRRC